MITDNLKFWFKTFLVYALLSLSFSLIGIVLDYYLDDVEKDTKTGVQILRSASLEHVLGHVGFGMIVALPTLAYRYIIASGGFAILLDADHLIQFFGIENIARMGHGFIFAILVIFIMMIIFGKKDYLLGVISFAAILSHISFDILLGNGSAFPLFAPITTTFFTFQQTDWLFVLISGMLIVLSIKIIVQRKIHFEKLNK
tara:strand:- start:371 stop:970 length:600 start_codon:yes stop_codon:yes gene_type:complete